ncbi:MAG: hypothetical protein AB7F89_11400 [Pirellulaceae bacterium]
MDAVSPLPVSTPEATLREIEQPYLGQWTRLVSTTNWEKGRIIHEWRAALSAAGESPTTYSDETWSQRVGGVSGQHVGRLRRVYDRFGQTQQQYAGLYWSHFQAALDWEDAEMWLEGAIQNRWSVSAMRRTRWETMGGVAADEPLADESVSADVDVDEDYVTTDASHSGDDFTPSDDQVYHRDAVDGPTVEGPDFGEEDSSSASQPEGAAIYADEPERVAAFVQPFENLGDLPPDFGEAFDAMKLAILRHKADAWQQISCDEVLAALDALKELARAPSAEHAPF